jgi:hypothetical protein
MARLKSLEPSIVGRTVSLATPILPKQLIIPLPELFDRTRSKLKPFLVQAELYIGFNIDLFPAEERKVL